MKKIISLFQRNYDGDRQVRDEVTPGAEWVIAGEGVATQKFDGTCCMVRGGKLYKRYDHVKGKVLRAQRRTEQGLEPTPPPVGFEPAQDPDPVTGHWPGWLPVGNGPEDKYHREAFNGQHDGTYELCGPKVQGNPEGYSEHHLIPHGQLVLHDAPRTFEELRKYLRPGYIEGVVWHHPDGRMVKIKAKDFGYKRATELFEEEE